MSSKYLNRIKGLHIKEGPNSYTDLIPFGSNGELIDMVSTLDLEEELKIGGNHYFEISEDENDITIIKEWYLTQPKGNEDNLNQICRYTVITAFSESPVSTALEVGQNQNDPTVLIGNTQEEEEQEIDIDLFILQRDENTQSVVQTILFNGYVNVSTKAELDDRVDYLHKKKIIINPPTVNGGVEKIIANLDFEEGGE